MPTNKFHLTAERIINDVAVECGLDSSADPVGSTSKAMIQLTTLLNIAIEELAGAHQWEIFNGYETFTTDSITYPTGEYPLPDNFHYMIPQSSWDLSNRLPLAGPLSVQEWAYLVGRNLSSSTIYAAFRQSEGVLALFPAPPDDDINISYHYQTTDWVRNAADDGYTTRVETSADTVLFAPSLIRAYLRSKFQGARGFDTITADEAVAIFLASASGKDNAGPVLNMGRRHRFPYLDPWKNVRDTGYGS